MKIRGRLCALNVALLLLVNLVAFPAAAASGYLLVVNGTQFYSTQNTSGDGWRYDAKEQTLFLKDYLGGAIRASGDLTIYAEGNTRIVGSNATNYSGGHGITVDGEVSLYLVADADVEITAGNGRSGGHGIYADIVYIDDDEETQSAAAYLTITGGRGTSSYGGDGINAGRLVLYPDEASVLIYGGKGYTYGGDGVEADTLYCAPAWASISGGQGVTDRSGCGIYYKEELDIGICNMNVSSYDSTGYAVAVPSGSDTHWYMSDHMIMEKATDAYDNELEHIRYYYPKQYSIKIDGAGGLLPNGQNNCTLTGDASKDIALEEYQFERDGYLLIGYENDEGWFFTANEAYYIYGDDTLTAQWAPFDEDTVLFLSSYGITFKNGEYYIAKTAGDKVDVPTRNELYLDGEADGYEVYQEFLGWTNVKDTSFPSDAWIYEDDDSYAVATKNAIWYQPGTTAEISGGTVLYTNAVYTNSNIVRYLPNGGENSKGGNCIMRAYYPVFFDGTLYVLDNGDEFTFTRPGYTFVGWNTKANGSGTWMDAGDELPYVEMDPPNVYNLYAQWKASVITVTLDGNGGSFGGKANAIVTGEANDTLNLKDYAFLRGQQYTLAGWNTKADGSGKAYSVNDVYTLSDSITLYAQWKARSFTYDGAGCAAGDQVSFDITPADGTVQATLSVVSVKNNSPFDRKALAILAVYDGEGKMLAAEASELYITSEGVSGKLSVEYNAGLVLNACQLFLLDGQSLEAMSDVIYTTFQ